MGMYDYMDFHHPFDDEEYEREYDHKEPSCKYCGATDVRWRMQTGRWTLFSLKPGVLHVCPIPDDFDVVPE